MDENLNVTYVSITPLPVIANDYSDKEKLPEITQGRNPERNHGGILQHIYVCSSAKIPGRVLEPISWGSDNMNMFT